MSYKKCVLFDDKECDNCGECDICDLDRNKKCDNCGKCIDYDESMEYAKIDIEKIILNSDEDDEK